jgi:repressor LexA
MEKVAKLGERLRELMRERSLNYEKLGELLEMRPQTLNRYVLGQREPKARVLQEMAERLQVDPQWLLGYDVPRHTTGGEQPLPGERLVPILGVIRAGIPTLAQQEVLGYLSADVPATGEYFYLKVAGDSMINAGIYPGDLVLMRQQSAAEDGQIVACLLNSEDATLKRFHHQEGWVILQPENPAYPPRLVPDEDFAKGTARIAGVAVRLVRNL